MQIYIMPFMFNSTASTMLKLILFSSNSFHNLFVFLSSLENLRTLQQHGVRGSFIFTWRWSDFLRWFRLDSKL